MGLNSWDWEATQGVTDNQQREWDSWFGWGEFLGKTGPGKDTSVTLDQFWFFKQGKVFVILIKMFPHLWVKKTIVQSVGCNHTVISNCKDVSGKNIQE